MLQKEFYFITIKNQLSAYNFALEQRKETSLQWLLSSAMLSSEYELLE